MVEGAAQSTEGWTPVAVRILEATASSQERAAFLNSALVYRCESHPNILRLLGKCVDSVPFLLIQEFCPQVNILFLIVIQAHQDFN